MFWYCHCFHLAKLFAREPIPPFALQYLLTQYCEIWISVIFPPANTVISTI